MSDTAKITTAEELQAAVRQCFDRQISRMKEINQEFNEAFDAIPDRIDDSVDDDLTAAILATEMKRFEKLAAEIQ